VFEAGYEALLIALDPSRLLWLAFGASVGLVVGILPGLGGTVGMAILLPFVFGMDPFSGIALLMGMAAVVHTGDTFPSVLLGVPGSSGSQATIMDGYPLAQQGEAGRALGAAFIVSMVGGLIGAVTLFGIVGVARPLILALGAPELFMFAMLGLSMVGVLSRGSPAAGFVSGLLGMLIGVIGLAPQVGQYRFVFDQLYLYDGVPIAVVALGLFALPEMIDLVAANRSISQTTKLEGGRMDGLRDVLKNKMLVVRSAMLGTGLGIIPGVGGSVVDWIAYGITKQSSKNNENFGNGDIRGVIGPESANNAKEGGALIPTLLFGIPGSGTTAMLLGGLLLLGIQPGPSMVGDNLDATLSIAWSLALANVLGTMGCLALSKQVSKLSLIPAKVLTPFLLVIMTVAAYQATRNWGDIVAFIAIGILGWVMKQVGFPRAPMLIGYVLAVSAERYLHLSMSLYDYGWFTRPIVIGVFVLILLVLFGSSFRDYRKKKAGQVSGSSVSETSKPPAGRPGSDEGTDR
jgi:putative tricarboxylic transport membrane protein